MSGVDMKHDPCDLFPIRTFRVRIEQAQVSDEMLLIVGGQSGICRGHVGYFEIKRRIRHWNTFNDRFGHTVRLAV